jgi:hypothetical protein
MAHQPPRTDAWAIGALISSILTLNSPELLGPEQNDLRRTLGSIWEESTASSTHADVMANPNGSSLDGLRKPLGRKPHTMNATRRSTLPDDNIMHNPEDLNDGTSISKGREIAEDSLAEGC